MKIRILSLLFALCLVVLVLPTAVVAAETFTYKVSANTTTPAIGSEFEVIISLTNYAQVSSEIRGLQIDVGNIDTNVLEVVSHSTMISDTSAASNKTSYSAGKNYIRLVYLHLAGTMDKSVTDVMKLRLKVKSALTDAGSITLPITLKIGTMSSNITLTDSLTIDYHQATLPPLKFAGASISLQHNIAINYKVNKALFEQTGYTNPYVVFELNGNKTTVSNYTISDNRYVFTFQNIAPNQMNDTIKSTLYATYDGVEYTSATREYSVAEYCYSMLDLYTADQYAELRTLLVDLLHYGAASQTYTGYKEDALVNTALTAAQLQWGTAADPALDTVLDTAYKTVANPTAKWKGAGLYLQGSVTMRLKFTAENIDGLTVKIESEGRSWTIPSDKFLEDDGVYYVLFTGLDAGQMRQSVYLTICNGDTPVSNTVRYSIESYAHEKQNSTIPGFSALLKAMMKYGDSAYAYAN